MRDLGIFFIGAGSCGFLCWRTGLRIGYTEGLRTAAKLRHYTGGIPR